MSINQTFPIVDRQGWTDDTVLALVDAWLAEHPRYQKSLEAYLMRVAREENAEASR